MNKYAVFFFLLNKPHYKILHLEFNFSHFNLQPFCFFRTAKNIEFHFLASVKAAGLQREFPCTCCPPIMQLFHRLTQPNSCLMLPLFTCSGTYRSPRTQSSHTVSLPTFYQCVCVHLTYYMHVKILHCVDIQKS